MKIIRESQPYPTGSFLLLAAAVLPYILMLALIWDGPSWGDAGGEARYSEGWAQFFAVAFGILLWLALGGLVLLAGLRGHVPQSWGITAAALYLFAVIATVGAAQSYFSWPGGWSIFVPALLPPLLALYAVCARLPVLAAEPLRLVPIVTLGAVALVAFTAIPFAFIDPVGYSDRLAEHKRRVDAEFDRIAAEHQASARQWEADMKSSALIRHLRPGSNMSMAQLLQNRCTSKPSMAPGGSITGKPTPSDCSTRARSAGSPSFGSSTSLLRRLCALRLMRASAGSRQAMRYTS